MTETNPTLTEFLLARLSEDEEWARWSGAAQDAERSRGLAFVSSMSSSSVTAAGRVVAECEAKRRIVETYLNSHDLFKDPFEADKALGVVLELLALPYADHPDYREEWKP